jgi:hypothetical protein
VAAEKNTKNVASENRETRQCLGYGISFTYCLLF